MFYKKTVVLSAVDGSPKKAVMTLERVLGEYTCKLKLYNFKDKPSGILSLGVLCGGKVIKGVLKNISASELCATLDAQKDLRTFTCAVVQTFQGDVRPILVGTLSEAKTQENEVRIASAFGMLEKPKLRVDEVERELDRRKVLYDDELEEEIKKEIENNFKKECGEKCTSCKYREAFYESTIEPASLPQDEQTQDREIDNEPEGTSLPKFYAEIKPSLEKLFESYSAEEFLQSIVPSSKWVKVDYNNDGNFYVVGMIFENETLKFIAYGAPGIYAELPPKELSKFAEWLPLDETKPFEAGYWLTYQNAETGENEKVEII